MKYLLSLKLCFLITAAVHAQNPLPIESIYSLIKQKSIHSPSKNWDTIDNGFKRKLKVAQTGVDSIKSFLYVFEALGDVHSSITYNGAQYANYPVFDDTTLNRLIPMVTKSQEELGKIKCSILSESIAYIQIPGIQAWGEMTNVYAQSIADTICILGTTRPSGFIVDLRLNGGGQLSSMLSGLNLLLGDNYLGGGIDIEGNEMKKLSIVNGNLNINGVAMTNISNNCKSRLDLIPVVVIIGPATRSSGSIVAISFEGRANTYFVGEATADGYSTGNDFFYIAPNLDLNLSTHFSQDRNGRVYQNSVKPDKVIIGGDNFDQLMNDRKIIAAIQWIKSGNHSVWKGK